MFIKRTVILAISLMAISTSYAEYGKGYKVLSERFISTPGSNAKIVHDEIQNFTLPQAKLDVSGSVMTYDARGKIMEFIKVESDHSITLVNYTSSTKRYTYNFVLSCDSAYSNFGKDVELAPQGFYTDSAHLYGTVQEEKEGSWGIHAQTSTTGAENYERESSAVLSVE